MVVGIGEILTFNRKCTIFVGLLFAVIFFTLIMVPSQADDDDSINKVSNQIAVDAEYPGNTIGAQSDTYFDKVNQLLTVWHVNRGGVLNIELSISQDLTPPVITDFKVEPNTSVSVNNPAIASVNVEDENLYYIDFEFIDWNNLIDTNTMLLWCHMNYSGINDTYFSPPWYANAWIITNGTVDDIVTTITDAEFPDSIIILGNFTQNATSEEEEALLWFNISTGNLNNVTRDDTVLNPLTIESGVSTFKVFNIKFDISEDFEEGPTYTLYTIEHETNPYLVSIHVSTGTYEVGVIAEDNNSNYCYNWTEIEVDSIWPIINSVTLNTTTPNAGDDILITVNATDNVAVTSVEANGIALTHQVGDIWNGSITAQADYHIIHIKAIDAAGLISWNDSVEYFANNTPIGTDVQVEIPEINATITFSEVTKSGQTYISEFNDDPSPPTGYNVLSNYYDIVTTAEYTGDITICINYNDSQATNEDNINILHYEERENEIYALMQENIGGGDTVWYLNATTYPDVLLEGSSESLYFVIDGIREEINKSNFVYSTSIYDKNGEPFIAWLDEPMYVIESGGDWYLSELIVDEDEDDGHLLRVGETLALPKGFAITLLGIDVDGEEAWFSVTQDGEEVESLVVDEDQQFRYETDLNESGYDDNWVLRFWVESVIAGKNTNLVKINSTQLLDPEVTLIETPDDDTFDGFQIDDAGIDTLLIHLDASDDTIDLKLDGIVNLICDKFRFKLNEDGDTGGVLKRPDATGLWKDVTSSLDTDTNIICGVVTNLSDFVIAEQSKIANNTPEGSDVQVDIPEINATITFSEVTKSGQTYISEFNDDPSPPTGYNVLSNYYDIVTTAEYAGDITICIDYDDSEAVDEDKIKILHYEENENEIYALMQENISVGDTVWDLNGTTYPDVLYGGSSESLHFVIDGTRLEINKSNFVYSTSIYDKNGERFIAWLAEPMFVIESAGDWYLSELLVDEDDDDEHLLRVGETMTLPKGFAITLLEIDVDGEEAWFSVTQDGEEVENVVVDEDQQFRYETDLNESGDDDNWVLTFWVESVIADMNTNLVKINSIQLLDPEITLIETPDDDLFTDFEIKNDNNNALIIELDASDDTIDLKRDGIVNLICDKFRFKLDENGDTGGVLKRPDATGLWKDVTSSLDTDTNIICGVVTNLSDFIIAESIIDTMPTAILTQPEEGAYIRGTIDINGTANDTNFYNYTIEWKNTTVDWTEIHNSTVPVSDGTLATWNTVNLEDGGYSIRLTVADNASNSNITLINVTIDNTLPTAILIQPEEGAFIRGIIDINGIANDTNFKNYLVEWKNTSVNWTEIKNSTVFVSDGTIAEWNTISLEDGNYMIKLTVNDNGFNSNMTLVNVTIDNTPPAVSNVTAQPYIVNIFGYINITADVSGPDVYNVSARITYPNNSTIIHQMNITSLTSILGVGSLDGESGGGGGGGVGNGRTEYHLDFGNTADPGRYNVTIIANDTTGNVNDTQKTSFIVAHIYNIKITTNASNSTFIDAPGTNVTLELFTNDSITGSINITRSIVNITDELDVPGPGIYIRINASTNFSNDNYSNLSWALIKVNYTDEDVSNNSLEESTLRLYWYNKSSGHWIRLETNSPTWVYGSDVDIDKNYVWANVSRFSDYALGGALETPPPSNGDGDGGGGGSSGGGASGELYENIACSETDRQYVYQNSDISYSFDLDCNIVQYVNFTGLTNAGRITTKVEILNDTSALVDNPSSDIVYKNLNIWVGNAGWGTERNIADATVVFTVDKSWITKNNIDESSIALYRYSDDAWHKLVTKKISEDANSLQFEAETPGFSPFAVTGKTIGEPGGEGIIEPTVTAEKTPAPTPTEEKGIPGFGLFAGLSVLLIAVQLLRKKK